MLLLKLTKYCLVPFDWEHSFELVCLAVELPFVCLFKHAQCVVDLIMMFAYCREHH